MLSQLPPQAGLTSVACVALLAMSGRSMSLRIIACIVTRGMPMGCAVRFVELLGLLPIMTFAGNEGHGRKHKEHWENFHRAPSIPS
jgi:hypothetical protein